MSTVQNLVDSIKYTINDTRITSATGIQNTLVPWINDAIHEIDWELFIEESDLVKTRMTPVAFDAGDTSKALPDDFIAFFEQPWITGKTTRLVFIAGQDNELQIRAMLTGTPEYYEIIGRTLYLFGPPSEAVTVDGFYLKWSTPVEDADSTVPFDGLLDKPIQDFLVKMYTEANTTRDKSGQLLMSGGTQTMRQLLDEMVQQVKSIVLLRPGHAKLRRSRVRDF